MSKDHIYGKRSTKYPSQHKSYLWGKKSGNENTYVAIYINRYYQYIFHIIKKIFSILLHLQTNLFVIDMQKKWSNIQGQVVNPWPNGPKHHKDNQSQSLKHPSKISQLGCKHNTNVWGSSIAKIPFWCTQARPECKFTYIKKTSIPTLKLKHIEVFQAFLLINFIYKFCLTHFYFLLLWWLNKTLIFLGFW